jgi:hypothetical protein
VVGTRYTWQSTEVEFTFVEALPPHGGGPANQEVQSAVMGTKVTGVNLVFADDGRAYIDVTTF